MQSNELKEEAFAGLPLAEPLGEWTLQGVHWTGGIDGVASLSDSKLDVRFV